MMASLKEVDKTAANGEENEFPKEEDSEEELAFCQTAERRHVDALLDISEELLLKELEPFEIHSYNGWDEAVRGWARVDPLSCIRLTPKMHKKSKHKEAATPTPSSVNLTTPPNTANSSTTAKHHCKTHVSWKSSLFKSTQSNQHMGSWSNTAVSALQTDATAWPVINALQETTSNHLFRVKAEQEEVLKENHHASTKHSVSDNRPSKPQKHSHRPNSTVVPIKNFTFLPPIKPLLHDPQRNCAYKTTEEDMKEGNCFMFDNKSRTRGTRMDPTANPELVTSSTALTSKYRTCQHNPRVFSVSIPRRYQVPTSSKPDTLHHTSFSTQALHSSTAASQGHLHPNKTVCAATLSEGFGINV
ncbi:uncharacterized protein si:ch73-103b9.2 [Cheilinus undulatus]|uniref:uncharacterized protein si:ch73-103b9.2 n=1 Tax=Cheilinus undulatus TaxID=241271 RepID=UPI001BD53A84|nr:uncharacterized protein si:ch73-103b9.2 [Cheilinus undulatus]